MTRQKKARHTASIEVALLSGVAFGIATLLCTLFMLQKMANSEWRAAVFFAPFSAFLLGTIGWRLLFRYHRQSIIIGAAIGLLIGILIHPLSWYLMLLQFYFKGINNSLGPLQAVPISFVMAMYSLIVVGWLSLPIGALIGALLGFTQNRAHTTGIIKD